MARMKVGFARAVAAAAVVTVCSGFAAAQSDKPVVARQVYAGSPASGQLTTQDQDDDTLHQHWLYFGESGERISVSVTGTGFSPSVAVYMPDSEEYVGEGPSTGSTFVLPADGDYVLCVHVHEGVKTGAFTLNVQSLEILKEWDAMFELKEKESIGKLGYWAGDDTDAWYFFGSSDESVRITMRPRRIAPSDEDFDSYLRLGRIENGKFKELAADDDGAGGKASRLDFQLPSAGLFVVRAGTYNDRPARGHYSISLEKMK